ncbi:putative exo-1 [Escovopsis weberi]|uniref:xylan 1,4-beta-xylosidase n=1 Tax=Escovopsis weberi TaxID=150374 RepID=A0A0N0RTV2_ESCWE|nr:putative exo-1 [Escovopsis weberi]
MNIYQIKNPDSIFTNNPGVPKCDRDPLCSTGVCNTDLSIGDRAAAFVKNMTLAEKIQNLDNVAPGVPRLGLPPYNWWSEALHGVAGGNGVSIQPPPGNFSAATAFPAPIHMSAAFDFDLVFSIGEIISTEARAFYDFGFAGASYFTPNINPFRDPRWGRGQETPGEDPFVGSQYALAMVTGLQGQDPDYLRVIATCKHYAAYDVENTRFQNDVHPSMQDMSEYFLPAFKKCVADAHAASVMCSYNGVDGTPSCANSWLLETVLREHFGFSEAYNYVVTDCDAVDSLVTGLHFAPNLSAGAADALNGGTDLDCGSTFGSNLNSAVQAGLTTEAAITKAVTRLVAALIKVGYFDQPDQFAHFSWADVNTTSSRNAAYQAATEGMVLLKNDGTLPITKAPGSVALIGPMCNATTQILGNYAGTPAVVASPLDAFKSKWQNVQFQQGTGISSDDTSGFAAAIAAAKNADVIFYCGGLDKSVEDEARDRDNIDWPGNQKDLITQLAGLGKKLVVLQFGGGQVDDSDFLKSSGVNSILWTGYPGQEGGRAIFDTVTGASSPAGRLPVTQYPSSYTDSVDMLDMTLRPGSNPGRTYWWYNDAVVPFGYGLHYTQFEVTPTGTAFPSTDISLLPGNVTVSFNVKNVGSRTSDYVALLFVSSCSGPTPCPLKKLVAFTRLHDIAPGQTQKADLVIDTDLLARADDKGTQSIYPGMYFLMLDVVNPTGTSFTLTGSTKQVSTLPSQ